MMNRRLHARQEAFPALNTSTLHPIHDLLGLDWSEPSRGESLQIATPRLPLSWSVPGDNDFWIHVWFPLFVFIMFINAGRNRNTPALANAHDLYRT
jgi:hypothetical protein